MKIDAKQNGTLVDLISWSVITRYP